MTNYSTVLDDVTVNSGGGTKTSNSFDLFLRESMSLKIEGDSNSTKVDVEVEARHDNNGSFGGFDSSFNNQDLTTETSNSMRKTCRHQGQTMHGSHSTHCD